jgi:hypothetical protein
MLHILLIANISIWNKILYIDFSRYIYVLLIFIGIWFVVSWIRQKLIKTSIIMLMILILLFIASFTDFLINIPNYIQYIVLIVLGASLFLVYERESNVN